MTRRRALGFLLSQQRKLRPHRRAGFVRVNQNGLVLGRRREDRDGSTHVQTPVPDQGLQESLAVRQQGAGRLALARIVENRRPDTPHLPGMEKGGPVDVRNQVGDRYVDGLQVRMARWDDVGLGRVEEKAPGPSLLQRQQFPFATALPVAAPQARILGLDGRRKGCALPRVGQLFHHPDAARGVQHVHNRPGVHGIDAQCRVQPRCGGAANQQGRVEALPFHLGCHVDHLIQGRRNQPAQPDQVRLPGAGRVQDGLSGHHHAQILDAVTIATQHHPHDVLADVVHIALHRGHDNAGLDRTGTALRLCLLNVGRKPGHGLLHHAGALDHLGQKHLAGAKEIADAVHAVHQRPFDDGQRIPQFRQRLGCILLGVLVQPVD